MSYPATLFLMLIVILPGSSYGEDNIYTWKDEQGIINITDYTPPDGAEILDVSPSHKEAAERIQRKRLIQQEKNLQSAERLAIKKKAVHARKIEAEALQKAEESLRTVSEMRKNKGQDDQIRRYRKNVARREEIKAEEFIKQAEAARKRAELLEKQLKNL